MSGRTLLIALALVIAAVMALVWAAMQLDPPPREERATTLEDRARGVGIAGRERTAAPGATAGLAPKPPDTRSGDPAPASGAATTRERPALGPGVVDPNAAFADEPRDEAWASRREADIRDRIHPLLSGIRGQDITAVDVTALECRSRRCQLAVSGTDPAAFQAFVEALQDERGFYGRADELMLSNYQAGDGRTQVTVTLVYGDGNGNGERERGTVTGNGERGTGNGERGTGNVDGYGER